MSDNISRTITPNPPADFTPSVGNYQTLQPFRYWCQKVLPLVYDDSLSYYELLCKVVDYLNKTMKDVETLHGDVTNLHTAYVKLQSYVNNYFSTLDVQEEINKKLDSMVTDGTFHKLLSDFLGIFVTPEMFGAVGDGITDDSQAFKDMFLSSRFIYLTPNKKYAILLVSVTQENTVIVGNNSTLIPFNPRIETTMLSIKAKKCCISDLNFYGSTVIGNTEQGCALLDIRDSDNTLNNLNFYNNKYASCRIFNGENIKANQISSYGTETTIIFLGDYCHNNMITNVVSLSQGDNFQNTNGEAVSLHATRNYNNLVNNVLYNKYARAVLIGRIDGSSSGNNNNTITNIQTTNYSSKLFSAFNASYLKFNGGGRSSIGIELMSCDNSDVSFCGDAGECPITINNSRNITASIVQFEFSRTVKETESTNIIIKNAGTKELTYNCPNSTIIDDNTFSSGIAKSVSGYSAINIKCNNSRNTLPIDFTDATSKRILSSTFQVYRPEKEADIYYMKETNFFRPTLLVLYPTASFEIAAGYKFGRTSFTAGHMYVYMCLPNTDTYVEIFSN